MKRKNFKTLEKIYTRVFLAPFFILSIITLMGCYLHYPVQIVSFICAMLLLVDVELYYLGMTKRDLERRFGMSTGKLALSKHVLRKQIFNFIRYDLRIYIFALLSLIFFIISLYGATFIIPMIYSYAPFLIFSTTIPQSYKLKKLGNEACQIQKKCHEQIEMITRTYSKMDVGSRKYASREIRNKSMIAKRQVEFIEKTTAGMNYKFEIFKYVFTAIVLLL
ncbi:MAG: hypothetical protein ACTSRA_00445 [Promethearchaeota archaeon]